jgi:hypothetical protein
VRESDYEIAGLEWDFTLLTTVVIRLAGDFTAQICCEANLETCCRWLRSENSNWTVSISAEYKRVRDENQGIAKWNSRSQSTTRADDIALAFPGRSGNETRNLTSGHNSVRFVIRFTNYFGFLEMLAAFGGNCCELLR